LPIYVGWKCFPLNKGLVTSLICACNGVGTIFASIISVYIVNPNNTFPSIKGGDGNIVYNYYDNSVSENVPKLFRYLALGEFVILLFALFHVWIPPYDMPEEAEIRMPWR
jgi:hypothetical protein